MGLISAANYIGVDLVRSLGYRGIIAPRLMHNMASVRITVGSGFRGRLLGSFPYTLFVKNVGWSDILIVCSDFAFTFKSNI